MVAFQVANILAGFAAGVAGSAVAVGIVSLALLLAPPSRRHFRRDPAASADGSRAGRAIRVTAAVAGGLVLGASGYAIRFPPEPVSGDLDLVRSDRPGLRVLFVGNDAHRQQLDDRDCAPARAGRARRACDLRRTLRGSTLEDAVDDDRLTELLDDERRNYVVLQEHSQRASRADERKARTLPAATELTRLAARAGARTVPFANPGYEDGDEEVEGDTREAMHARLRQGSRELASRLPAVVAPVGDAWEAALRRRPQLDLWIGDGIRPTETGSYLTRASSTRC